MAKVPVSIVGATGAVGQQLLVNLAHSATFLVHQVMASSRHHSRPLRECAKPWMADAALVESLALLPVEALDSKVTSQVVFSALPSEIAGPFELELKEKGHLVFSLASAHRLESAVPMVVMGVNEAHLEGARKRFQKGEGVIICKPNCVAAILASALKPLLALGLTRVDGVSLQSLSGAGYPGPSAWLMGGDLLPEIEGEESKIEAEIPKLLGQYNASKDCVEEFSLAISMSCLRVNVARGHSLQLTLDFASAIEESAFRRALDQSSDLEYLGESLDLSPARVIARRQPMKVYWGRLRKIAPGRFKLWVVGDNLGRGAAAGALALAEYFCKV